MTSQIGTFTYASPEQIDGGEYDSSTDIFSLGVILFEMCHLPFPTGMERIVTISNAREGIFATYWESLSKSNPGICNLLNRLLSTIPSNRPTAAEVVETCEILRCEILNTLTCMYFNLKKKLEKKIEKEDPCGLYFLFYRVRILIFEYDINLFYIFNKNIYF